MNIADNIVKQTNELCRSYGLYVLIETESVKGAWMKYANIKWKYSIAAKNTRESLHDSPTFYMNKNRLPSNKSEKLKDLKDWSVAVQKYLTKIGE